MMNSGTTINIFRNEKVIANRQKVDIPVSLKSNAGSKVVDVVGENNGTGQKHSSRDD